MADAGSIQVMSTSGRLDGFASVQAPCADGEVLTEPLVFGGNELRINFSTSAAGSVRVEIQNAAGQPIPGHTLKNCPEITGDSVDRVIRWKAGADISSLAGETVKLRFELKDADLYSFQFNTKD